MSGERPSTPTDHLRPTCEGTGRRRWDESPYRAGPVRSQCHGATQLLQGDLRLQREVLTAAVPGRLQLEHAAIVQAAHRPARSPRVVAPRPYYPRPRQSLAAHPHDDWARQTTDAPSPASIGTV